MKKLGKNVSFLTKIMLVFGLLISNLSSLTVVFAYEATDAVQIAVVDEKLNIKYTDELAEEVEIVNLNVYENYTYLDNSSYFVDEFAAENGETGKVSNYSLTSEELLALEGYEVESILSVIDFDGLYEVKVEITDVNNEVIDSAIYSENIEHESGLTFKMFDEMDNEIVLMNGVYPVGLENSKVKVVAQILSGGLSPMDMFMYEEVGYTATELLEYTFSNEMDLNGRLFGEYVLPFEVKLLDADSNEVVYSDELTLMYESYDLNTLELNTVVEELELTETYEFVGDSKDGVLFVLLNSDRAHTMLDLYNIVKLAVSDSEIISYVLSNSELEDVLAAYDEETATVTLEEYLESIVLDDSSVLSLVNDGLTVTYKVVVTADMNGDNVLTNDDLLGLINQVVGSEDKNVSKADLNKDTKVDTLDVMYLNEVIKTGAWEVELSEIEATLESMLVVEDTDIISGDEFTVLYKVSLKEYAINGVSGLFKYDDTMLELVNIEANNEWLGNFNDGKFLYLGEESLTGKVVLDENDEEVFETEEYVLVTATFRALKSGESVISLEETEYFDGVNYLLVEQEEITISVLVNASNNNSLKSLFVAGQEIELIKDENGEDVLEYEITVGNDVTMADVEAIVENVAASITSIVYPEELVEGENTITITVTSESGDVKVYTIIVNREAALEEETVIAPVNNNYYNDYDNEEDEVVVTPAPEEEEEDDDETLEDEESNVSRIIIIVLILLVIAGLVYLIFKDDEDEDAKKANKAVDRLRKEEVDAKVESKVEKTVSMKPENKSVNKSNNSKNSNKNKGSNNKKR